MAKHVVSPKVVGCYTVITNSLVHNEANSACSAFSSSPLEPVRQSPAAGANDMCSILTHSATENWDILLHGSARTYEMSLNSLIFKIDFSFSEGLSFHPGVAKGVSMCEN